MSIFSKLFGEKLKVTTKTESKLVDLFEPYFSKSTKIGRAHV